MSLLHRDPVAIAALLLTVAVVVAARALAIPLGIWQPVSGLPADLDRSYALLARGADLFLGNGNYQATEQAGVYIRRGEGGTWERTLTGMQVRGMTFGSVAGRLYAATYGNGLRYSTDWGQTWTRLGSDDLAYLYDVVVFGNTLVVATGEAGVYRSTDNGATWQHPTGLPGQSASLTAAADGSYLLLGTRNAGVYRSTNLGQTWVATTGLPTGTDRIVRAVAVMQDDAAIAFAAVVGAGVYRSADRGVSWQLATSNLGGSQWIYDLWASRGSVLAATENQGVWHSLDSGASWASYNDGLDTRSVYALYVDGAQRYAAANGGVWRRIISDRIYLPLTLQQPTLTFTATPTPTPTPTVTAEPAPGLRVRGHVRLNNALGPGVADVAIHLYLAVYAPGPVVATTDADGYYETPFYNIVGDEMVTVWVERTGYTFDPLQHSWRHYSGVEDAVRDFVAFLSTPTPTATSTATQGATATVTPSGTPTLTRTPTLTPTPTRTPTASASATASPTETASPTATGTPSATRTSTSTITRTPTRTPTRTLTPTWTRTPTFVPTWTPTPTPTLTHTATRTPTDAITRTPTPTPTPGPVVIGTPIALNPGAQNWARWQISAAYDSVRNRYLLVWWDKRNDIGREWEYCYGYHCNGDIYGRIVTADGATIVGDFAIRSTSRDEEHPYAVYNAMQDEFLVAWQEADPAATSDFTNTGCYNIMAQRVTPAGGLAGGAVTVSDAVDCQWVPQIALDTISNRYLLAWHDNRYRGGRPRTPNPQTGQDVFGQYLYYSGGSLVRDGGNFVLATTGANPTPAANNQQFAALLKEPGGDFYACWSDARNGATADEFDIWCDQFADGATTGFSNSVLYADRGTQEKPAMARDSSHNIWITWQSYPTPNPGAPGTTSVQALRANLLLTPVAAAWTVAANTGDSPLPGVACVPGVCAIAYGGWNNIGNNPFNVRRYDTGGNLLSTHTIMGSGANEPRIVAGRSGFLTMYTNGGRLYIAGWQERTVLSAAIPWALAPITWPGLGPAAGAQESDP